MMDSERIKAINILIGAIFFATEEMPNDPVMRPIFENEGENKEEVKIKLMSIFLHAMHKLGVSESELAEAMIHAPFMDLGVEQLLSLDNIRIRKN